MHGGKSDHHFPGILPWQALFLAAACGAWTLHDPAAGGLAALLVVIVNRLAGRKTPRVLFFALAALTGLAYAWARLPAVPETPAWMDGRPRGVLTGVAASVEDKPGGRVETLLRDVSFVFEDGRKALLPGLAVWTWQDPAFRPVPGSVVALRARPHPTGGFDNPGGSDWGWRWRTRGVFWRVYTRGPKAAGVTHEAAATAAQAWRLGLREAILKGAGGGSAAGMVLGLVTGERHAIGTDDLDRVRRASLSHLLAVSGMNLAAVVAMGWGLSWLAGLVRPSLYLKLPRPKLAVILSVPLVLGYLWLGRFEPSLTRAALMFASWGVLLMLGRSNVLLDGLFFALAAMFLWNPLCVFDVGLQLSACAVAGMVLLVPMALPLIRRIRAPGAWRLAAVVVPGWLAVTLAAQLSVLPIQTSVFGEVSPHLYLNLLWVPVVEWAAQPLAYLGALTVTWWPGAGDALLSLSGRVCSLMLESLAAMDARGWLSVYPVQRPWQPEALGYFLFLGALPWAASMSARGRVAWLALCVALAGSPGLYRTWEQGRDRVSLTMLDVGQGQALLVEAPGGRRWLVDAGGAGSDTFDVGRAVLSPALTWGRPPELDGIVMSHPDRDHTGGLPYLLETYRIGFLAGNGELPDGDDFKNALAASRLAPRRWMAGERVELADGLHFEVLSPQDDAKLKGNDASLVLRLVWRGRGLAVLPGDAGREVLDALAASGADLSADALAVPHHGSKSGLSRSFYARTGARLALVSNGRGNRYGFPAGEVSGALEDAGARVLQTAREGAVTLSWKASGAGPEVLSRRGPGSPLTASPP